MEYPLREFWGFGVFKRGKNFGPNFWIIGYSEGRDVLGTFFLLGRPEEQGGVLKTEGWGKNGLLVIPFAEERVCGRIFWPTITARVGEIPLRKANVFLKEKV